MADPGAREWLRSIVDSGEVAMGIGVNAIDPSTTEIAALAGCDFVMIDCEHSPMSPLDVVGHVRAAEARSIVPLVRTWENSQPLIQRFLDVGCAGVVVPHVESAEDAEAAIHATRFPPRGNRGSCPVVRAADYSREAWPDYAKAAETNALIIPIVESVKGVDNIREIFAVDGIDCVFFGPADLSTDMGVALEAPDIVSAWNKVHDAALKAGKHLLGLPMDGVDQSQVVAMIVGADLRTLRDALSARVAEIRHSTKAS